jgi:hypothetical protein
MDDLRFEVSEIIGEITSALTAHQVVTQLAQRFEPEVRVILNDLVKEGALTSVHGGGGYRTHYKAPPLAPIRRRI